MASMNGILALIVFELISIIQEIEDADLQNLKSKDSGKKRWHYHFHSRMILVVTTVAITRCMQC